MCRSSGSAFPILNHFRQRVSAPVPRQAIDSTGPPISNADILSSFVIIPGDAASAVGKAAAGAARRLAAEAEGRVAEGGHDDHFRFPEKPLLKARKASIVKNKTRTHGR
jgi:hypothetical protein